MKKSYLLFMGVSLVATMAAFFVITGCESEPSTDADGLGNYTSEPRMGEGARELTISVEPSIVYAVGDAVLLSVNNGDTPFSWSVADSSAGSIEVRDNTRQAVYTCLEVIPATVLVTDSQGRSGYATILANGSPVPSSLNLSPDTVTVPSGATGRQIDFSVSGGVPPYNWSVSVQALGSIASSGSQEQNATYTVGGPGASGENVITVRDQSGRSTTATVTQQ